jgi:hypothetical protein
MRALSISSGEGCTMMTFGSLPLRVQVQYEANNVKTPSKRPALFTARYKLSSNPIVEAWASLSAPKLLPRQKPRFPELVTHF